MTPAAAPAEPDPTLAAYADELGMLEKDYAIAFAPWKGKVERMDTLRDLLRAACPVKPAETWTVEGRRFTVEVGAAAIKRTINVRKLAAKIGARAFQKIATTTLEALKSLDPEIVADVVTAERTGPRRVTCAEKGAVS